MVVDFLPQLARIVVMYLFTIAMLRIAGKRRLASLSPADLIIIIALGSAVGDVLIYPPDIVSLEIAMLAVATIIVLQIIISKAVEKHPKIAYIVEGKRTLLIEDGKILERNLDDEDVSHDDLEEMLAERGVDNPSEVHKAYLERSGEVSIILKPVKGQSRQLLRKRIRRRI